jgi:hypothetical protein
MALYQQFSQSYEEALIATIEPNNFQELFHFLLGKISKRQIRT